MPKEKDKRVSAAFELYRQGMKLIEIANKLSIPEGTVRSWKNRYKWDMNGSATLQKSDKKKCNVAKNKKVSKKAVADEVIAVTQNTDLTDKQQLFCLYYIRSFNATAAYQKAYGCSYVSAMQNGSRMLRNTKVKEEILKMKQERLNREFLSEEDIFQKYMDIAFADITDFVKFGTEEVPVIAMYGPVKIKDEDTGEEKQLTKLVNTVKLRESTEIDGTIISEVKQGKDGASIKLADRLKALQWLSDHMDCATLEQKARIENLRLQSERLKRDAGSEEEDGVEIINDAPKEAD